MKAFLIKIIIMIPLFLLGLLIFILVIPNQYDESYQRVVSVQYESYKGRGSEKIVAIGGSSLAFGFDADYMEALTGKECQILGVHAAMGQPYMVEIAKSNIKQGDIIILEFINDDINKFGASLILTGIEDNFEMYRFFTFNNWLKALKGYPNYISKKVNYWLFEPLKVENEYSRKAFDETGNMIGNLEECVLPDPYPTIDVDNEFLKTPFKQTYVDYLNAFDDYCKERGATLLITQKSYFDEAVDFSEENMHAYDNRLETLLTAPLISNFEDYIFKREHISNGSGHCNKYGAKIRTKQIYDDMTRYFFLSSNQQ